MKTECTVAQGFGGNATATYKAGGLLGHSGIDQDCGFGSDIHSIWDSEYVYKVLTKENPSNDGSGFTGIFTIVEQGGKCFEFLYGHCNPSSGLLGKTITKGTVIGTQANNGEVYSNGERITLEMQKAGDKRGTHRHDQARELRKDISIQSNTRYLTALGGGYLYINGFFYAIPNYNNGFNGCFDWTKDNAKPKYEFQSVINYGARGRNVERLQDILRYEGFLNIESTGYFGDKTAESLIMWQKKHGIEDFVGMPLRLVRVGVKTMELLNKLYK